MESLGRTGLGTIQDKGGSVGLGILSWKDRLSLENALKSYRDQNFLSLSLIKHMSFLLSNLLKIMHWQLNLVCHLLVLMRI